MQAIVQYVKHEVHTQMFTKNVNSRQKQNGLDTNRMQNTYYLDLVCYVILSSQRVMTPVARYEILYINITGYQSLCRER